MADINPALRARQSSEVAVVHSFTSSNPAYFAWCPKHRDGRAWSQNFNKPEHAIRSALDHGYTLVVDPEGQVLDRQRWNG